MRKVSFVIAVAAATTMLAGCTSISAPRDKIARVNPSSVAAAPERWDGKQVEMVGLLVWEFENLGLYQDYGTFCRGGEHTAIRVDWNSFAGVTRADSRRQVVVRGTFHNQKINQPDGSIVASSGFPGPGPLEPGQVVRWLSAPAKPCPKALP